MILGGGILCYFKNAVEAMNRRFWDFEEGVKLTWYMPKETSDDPVNKKTNHRNGDVFDGTDRSLLKKNEKNWFYSTAIFPLSMDGISTDGDNIDIFVTGYCPFTLFIDGEEIFKEEHVWHATGPILASLPIKIVPGREYSIVACFEPTEIPIDLGTVQGIKLVSKKCFDMATLVSAPALELQIAEKLAKSEEDKAIVEEAAGLVDISALQNNDWDTFFSSVKAMEDRLSSFHDRAKALTVHLAGHTHIDMDWMWTWKDTEYCIRRDAFSVNNMLDDFKDMKFGVSQIPFYSTVKEKDPDVFLGIQEKVKEGRWECLASTWVEGDLNMADGESIARHFLYAKEWTKENLGIESKTLWEPDTFGHPANMPQLAKKAEIDNYFHWRCNPGAFDNWPLRYWEGVDGTKIFAASEPYGAGLNPMGLFGNIANYLAHGYSDILHIWGFGDHGGGIARRQKEYLDLYKDLPLIPKFNYTTIGEFLALAEKKYKDIIPSNFGETYTLFDGCFTTHSSVKQENRFCEGALLAAETLTALSDMPKKAELKEAWTKILFNHFHDIMDGAAVHDSYIDASKRSTEAILTANGIIEEVIADNVKTENNKITVFNTNGVKSDFVVSAELPEGVTALKCLCGCSTIIPVQKADEGYIFIAKDVPAFGAKKYEIVHDDIENIDITVTEDRNNFYLDTKVSKIALHKGSGVIGSYFDKVNCRELVSYGVNRYLTHSDNTRRDLAINLFQLIDESDNGMSAWLINDTAKVTNLLNAEYIKKNAVGPVFAEFEVKHNFRSSNLVERIRVYNDFNRVDFNVDIDWQELGSPEVGVPELKISFANKLSAARAYFEGPYFVPERPADGTEQPTQKYVAVKGDEGGFMVLNDSKYGCDVLGARARMTILRTGYNPDSRSDSGKFNFNFAFQPINNDFITADMVSAGISFNRPVIVIDGELAFHHKGMDIADKRVVCTALKFAESGHKRILRFFNTTNEAVQTAVSFSPINTAEEVNLLERENEEISVNDHTLYLSFGPYEIKTIMF